MKLIHLSDLHLGKRLNEFSLLEDQRHILGAILRIVDSERPGAVVVAGDVYDKSIPSVEANELFDDFLFALASRKIETFVISGNHDSPERLAFARRLIDPTGVHICPAFDGRVAPFELEDEYGKACVYMLPYVKPIVAARFWPDDGISSYSDAARVAVERMRIDPAMRNVLVAHQFVSGAIRSDSEERCVGGADCVDAEIFMPFDYVALGHLHSPQRVREEKMRYCGSPLKYSFSEAGRDKSVTVVELREKGSVVLRAVPLKPLRDMKTLKGAYAELTRRDFYSGTDYPDCYLRVTLTDEDEIPFAISKLRAIYPRIMKLDYDNARSRAESGIGDIGRAEAKTPYELFAELYETQNGSKMSDEQSAIVRDLIEKVWEAD